MPMLMQALLESWRDIERHCVEVAPDDGDHAWCLDLNDRMRLAYQRLFDVFPRADADTDFIRALLTEAVELRRAAAHRGRHTEAEDRLGRADGASIPNAGTTTLVAAGRSGLAEGTL